jgi:hypothetical protein
MGELTTVATLAKAFGVGGLIFVIWYLDKRSQEKKWMDLVARLDSNWNTIIQGMAAQHEQALKKMQDGHAGSLEQMRQNNQQTFDLLKSAIETQQMHTSIIARVEHKIDTNEACPYTKANRRDL